MSINPACKIWVKDYVEKAVKKGKKKSEAIKEVQKLIKKDWDVDVKTEAIRKGAQRASKKVGTNVPMCSRCEKNQVRISPKTKKPMEHGLCQNCVSDDKKKNKGKKKADDTKNGPVKNWSPDAEKYWKSIVGEMEKLLMGTDPVFGPVREEILNDVLNVQSVLNQRVHELKKESKS